MITGTWLYVIWVILGLAILIALVAVLFNPGIIIFNTIQEWIENLKRKCCH